MSIVVTPFRERTGPTFPVPSSPLKLFQQFFTITICTVIVEQTNLYARQVVGEEKYAQFEVVTVEEFLAYQGFCILMGLVQLPSLDDYWRRDEYLRYTPISD